MKRNPCIGEVGKLYAYKVMSARNRPSHWLVVTATAEKAFWEVAQFSLDINTLISIREEADDKAKQLVDGSRLFPFSHIGKDMGHGAYLLIHLSANDVQKSLKARKDHNKKWARSLVRRYETGERKRQIHCNGEA